MPKGYHHMTQEIRSEIYALKSTGMALSKIGCIVRYDASTISREIKRNMGGRGYRYKQADAMAEEPEILLMVLHCALHCLNFLARSILNRLMMHCLEWILFM